MRRDDMIQKKIGVLLGGRSSEAGGFVTERGRAVHEALLRKGYRAVPIDPADRLIEKVQEERIEAAVIVLHGKWGEDGTVQGLLEMMGIPYTGSGVLGSASAMDKVTMKYILTGLGLPTPPFTVGSGGRSRRFPPSLCGEAGERGLYHRDIHRKNGRGDRRCP